MLTATRVCFQVLLHVVTLCHISVRAHSQSAVLLRSLGSLGSARSQNSAMCSEERSIEIFPFLEWPRVRGHGVCEFGVEIARPDHPPDFLTATCEETHVKKITWTVYPENECVIMTARADLGQHGTVRCSASMHRVTGRVEVEDPTRIPKVPLFFGSKTGASSGRARSRSPKRSTGEGSAQSVAGGLAAA